MIAIFSLLGLVLFGGGLYAIYDGWPYLVLERGFTEVIIGSIAATGGIIMMSLAWVLKQIKAIRSDLEEAAEARLSARAPLDVAMPATPRDAAGRGEAATPSPVMPMAVGAGAIGLGAAAMAAAVVAEKPDAAAAGSGTPERDLFGALVADHLAVPAESEEHQEEPAEPARDEALPDMFETETAEVGPADSDHSTDREEESLEPAEIVAAKDLPLDQAEAPARSDDEAEAATQDIDADEADLEYDAADVEEPVSIKGVSERDEFAALRESLTSQLGGVHRPSGRIEPSLASEDDPFADAEAWGTSPGERREPSFDAPHAAAGSEAEPPMPAWPPRTEPQGPGTPAPHVFGMPFEATASKETAAGHITEEADSTGDAEPDEPERENLEETAPAASKPATQEPAASEEGIVGAYQVGETHFTIYADGSIQARTPEGAYSFASMDELKVYLASEKSRLGA